MKAEKVIVLMLAVASAVLLLPLINACYAQVSVGTYGTDGLPKDTFNMGENVRIMVESSDASVTITVTAPDNAIVQQETYERAILGSSDGSANQYFAIDKQEVSDVIPACPTRPSYPLPKWLRSP